MEYGRSRFIFIRNALLRTDFSHSIRLAHNMCMHKRFAEDSADLLVTFGSHTPYITI